MPIDKDKENGNELITREQADLMIQKAIAKALKKKEPMSKDNIIAALDALPAQTKRKFEKKVVSYAMNWEDTVFYIPKKTEKEETGSEEGETGSEEGETGSESEKITYEDGIIFEIINLITKPDSSVEDRKRAFYAFCVAENYARRSENRTDLQELMDKYGKYFTDEYFALHLAVCAKIKELEAYAVDKEANKKEAKEKDGKEEDKEKFDFDAIIADARRNMRQLTENIGGRHAFAETVLLFFENAPELMEGLTDKQKEKLLQEALDSMVIVLNADPYAKFYCTYGRLLAIAGKYDEALKQLNTAINEEDNTKSDYPIRIGRYLAYIQQVRTQQNAEKNKKLADEQLHNVIQTLEEQTRASNTKSMEFLGLFSGIVSFTIGSISISGEIESFTPNQVAGLIVVLMGALMGVFSGFGIILHGAWGKKTLRNLIVLLMGIGIIAGGMWLCSH